MEKLYNKGWQNNGFEITGKNSYFVTTNSAMLHPEGGKQIKINRNNQQTM